MHKKKTKRQTLSQLQSHCRASDSVCWNTAATQSYSELRTPTAKYFVTNLWNSLWISNCHLISRNFLNQCLNLPLHTCHVCQIPCTPSSLTAWYTGYNVIRRDPEQYVMTLVDGRGYGTGGADRSDWGSVLCILHIMAACWRRKSWSAPNVWCTPSKDFLHLPLYRHFFCISCKSVTKQQK